MGNAEENHWILTRKIKSLKINLYQKNEVLLLKDNKKICVLFKLGDT